MKFATVIAGIVFTLSMHAQTNLSFPLWDGPAPGSRGSNPKDVPTLTPFRAPAAIATGAAIVICPGGGYGNLADHEGRTYAQWLNAHGISAFVLKYRLGTAGYRHPAMLQDAARAVRLVRSRASEWGVQPDRIGIMGSSAGGHLASTLLTHFDLGNPEADDAIDRASSRPDLGILCYPVISMGRFTHRGSRANLLGTNATQELVEELSSELQVRTNTPPVFIWHTFEDRAVPVENSLRFAAALREKGIPFDLHVYEKGGHGLGLGVRTFPPEDPSRLLPWTHDCLHWLNQRGWTTRNALTQ